MLTLHAVFKMGHTLTRHHEHVFWCGIFIYVMCAALKPHSHDNAKPYGETLTLTHNPKLFWIPLSDKHSEQFFWGQKFLYSSLPAESWYYCITFIHFLIFLGKRHEQFLRAKSISKWEGGFCVRSQGCINYASSCCLESHFLIHTGRGNVTVDGIVIP